MNAPASLQAEDQGAPFAGTERALIDATSPTPLYHQIFLILEARIRRGGLRAGDRLPGEPELAQLFGVSRITARRAVGDLARGGLATRRRGRGTLVAEGQAMAPVASTFDTLVRSLEQMGADTTVELIDLAQEPSPEDAQDLLELCPGERVLRIARLRRLGGEPFSHLVSYLPMRIADLIPRDAFATQPMLSLLRQVGAAPASAEQWISAAAAEPAIASALMVGMGSPVLRIVRRLRDAAGRPVQLIRAHYHPQRYSYHLKAEGRPHEAEDG